MAETILNQRDSIYGEIPFSVRAQTAQQLKEVLRNGAIWRKLSYTEQEALEMIAHKLARIVSGNNSVQDSWDDLAGYALLPGREKTPGPVPAPVAAALANLAAPVAAPVAPPSRPIPSTPPVETERKAIPSKPPV